MYEERASALADLERWFPAVPRPPATDWAAVEELYRTKLPPDYKAFTDRFGAVRVQFLRITHPGPAFGQQFADNRVLLRAFYDVLVGDQRDDSWPDPDSLLIWGEIDHDVFFAWHTTASKDPALWPTFVFETTLERAWMHGDMTTCIRDMVDHTQVIPFATFDFEDNDRNEPIVISTAQPEATYPIERPRPPR